MSCTLEYVVYIKSCYFAVLFGRCDQFIGDGDALRRPEALPVELQIFLEDEDHRLALFQPHLIRQFSQLYLVLYSVSAKLQFPA